MTEEKKPKQMEDVINNLEIRKCEQFHNGHQIFIDGTEITVCRDINIRLSSDANKGSGVYAVVKMEFLARVNADISAQIDAAIAIIKNKDEILE